MRVVSAVALDAELCAVLAGIDVEHRDLARDPAAAADALATAEGVLVNSHVAVDKAFLDRAPALRVISTISAGYDHIDLEGARVRGIIVTTAPVLTDAVADLTMSLIVMVLRRLGYAIRELAEGRWRNELLGTDVHGKTLLVVGFGRIGREVASRAIAAKMRVLAFDVRNDLPAFAGVERVATLADGLARADVVSLHVDLNPSTRHLLDEAAFALMKPTAIVINAARGAVIDQRALTAALKSGRIAGAGLDVLEFEPPADDEPLLKLANVVVLPHIGSATVETRRAMLECAVANLAACLRGESCDYVLRNS
jgi:lactate dehydrogenase-like 2-hydroxyacid dehydrogenase